LDYSYVVILIALRFRQLAKIVSRLVELFTKPGINVHNATRWDFLPIFALCQVAAGPKTPDFLGPPDDFFRAKVKRARPR
jgi:hypothetical protein